LVRDRGLGVLWTTHLIDEVTADDAVVILHKGQILAAGRAKEIATQVNAASIGEAFSTITGSESLLGNGAER